MSISVDLFLVVLSRIILLSINSIYLFHKWYRAPRHYFSDFPFLMGVSFLALTISKFFDIALWNLFINEPLESQYELGRPEMPLGYARWLFMIAVMAPLLYANLCVWLSEQKRLRGLIIFTYSLTFTIIILQAKCFADLNALIIWILLPVAVITIVTFLFTYLQKRLPGVHGLLISLGWLGYVITTGIRPLFIRIGFVSIAEILDMLMWVVIFLGFVLKPPYARLCKISSP